MSVNLYTVLVKAAVSAAIVVGVSELAKRSNPWAALLAALPLTSLLAFVWVYLETGDALRVARLSRDIFWLVLPSLPLFLSLPLLLRAGWNFWLSLGLVCALTAALYLATSLLLRRLGLS